MARAMTLQERRQARNRRWHKRPRRHFAGRIRGGRRSVHKAWMYHGRTGFQQSLNAFTGKNCVTVGNSRDSVQSHECFKEKMQFPFELLSDADETVCELFGVMKLKNMYGKQVRGLSAVPLLSIRKVR